VRCHHHLLLHALHASDANVAMSTRWYLLSSPAAPAARSAQAERGARGLDPAVTVPSPVCVEWMQWSKRIASQSFLLATAIQGAAHAPRAGGPLLDGLGPVHISSECRAIGLPCMGSGRTGRKPSLALAHRSPASCPPLDTVIFCSKEEAASSGHARFSTNKALQGQCTARQTSLSREFGVARPSVQ
jgi:hypothetical protein